MNRKLLIAKLVALIVLLVVVCAIAVQVIFKGWGSMTQFAGSGTLVSRTEFSLAEEVDVNLASFGVEVFTHDKENFIVDFYRSGFGTIKDPTIELIDGVLTVKETIMPIGINLGSGKIIVYVPEGTPLPYTLHSTSGSVRLRAPSTSANLHSTSGSVKVYSGGETLTAESTSGSVKVYAPFKTIDANSTSGSVKLIADAQSESIKARSVSGSVKIALDGVTGYILDYKTVSGSVKDTYANAKYSGRYGSIRWGDESLKITAQSTSSSIKLTDWSD